MRVASSRGETTSGKGGKGGGGTAADLTGSGPTRSSRRDNERHRSAEGFVNAAFAMG